MWFYNKLRQLQFRFGRLAPQRLMTYIVGGMAMTFLADFLLSQTTGFSLSGFFMFNRAAVLAGQIWRIFTFVLIPPAASFLFILFTLYFYYLIGNTLEREWGSFWFDVYYLVGVVGTIAAGFISGYATNYYLNLSLFFAFAVMHPDFQILIFFLIPVKIKWIAYIDAAFFLYSFIVGTRVDRAAIIASLINFFIFFGPSFMRGIKTTIESRMRRAQFNRDYNRGRDDGGWNDR